MKILTKLEKRVIAKQEAELKKKAETVLRKAIEEGMMSPDTVRAHFESFHTNSNESIVQPDSRSKTIELYSGFSDEDRHFTVDSDLLYDESSELEDGANEGGDAETDDLDSMRNSVNNLQELLYTNSNDTKMKLKKNIDTNNKTKNLDTENKAKYINTKNTTKHEKIEKSTNLKSLSKDTMDTNQPQAFWQALMNDFGNKLNTVKKNYKFQKGLNIQQRLVYAWTSCWISLDLLICLIVSSWLLFSLHGSCMMVMNVFVLNSS